VLCVLGSCRGSCQNEFVVHQRPKPRAVAMHWFQVWYEQSMKPLLASLPGIEQNFSLKNESC